MREELPPRRRGSPVCRPLRAHLDHRLHEGLLVLRRRSRLHEGEPAGDAGARRPPAPLVRDEGRDHVALRPARARRAVRHGRLLRRGRRDRQGDQPEAGRRAQRLGQEHPRQRRRHGLRQPHRRQPLRAEDQRQAADRARARRLARLVDQRRHDRGEEALALRQGHRQPREDGLDPDERGRAAPAGRLPPLLRRARADLLLARPAPRPPSHARPRWLHAVARRVHVALPPPVDRQRHVQLRLPDRVHARLLARDRARGRERRPAPHPRLHARAEGAAPRLPDPVRHRPRRPRPEGPRRLARARRPRERAQVPDRLRRRHARRRRHDRARRRTSARTCRR